MKRAGYVACCRLKGGSRSQSVLADKKADVDDNKRVEPLCDTDAELSEQQRRGQRRGERSFVQAAVKLLTHTGHYHL